MQVKSFLLTLLRENLDYDPSMQKFGRHLADLRQAAGLSQYQLAAKLGVAQTNISFWERWDKPPRGEVLPKLAQILGVSTDELLNFRPARSGSGPKGKARQLFDAVSKLPRRQQEKIFAILEPFVREHGDGYKQAA